MIMIIMPWDTWKEKTHKYMGIEEADTIKQAEMKEEIRKAHLKQTRKLLVSRKEGRRGLATMEDLLDMHQYIY